MHLYSAKVRLAGNVLNEVRRENLTAAEVAVLRVVHGEDAVLEITKTGEDHSLKSSEVRQRLYDYYGGETEEVRKSRLAMFRNLLGHDMAPLPKLLPEVEHQEGPPVKRARKTAPVVAEIADEVDYDAALDEVA